MSKALVSNRIYLDDPGKEATKKIIKELTYKFEPKSSYGKIEVVRNYKILPKGIISIPQMRLDLIPDDFEIIDKRIKVPISSFPAPIFDLYMDQKTIYDQVEDSCIINARVGWGKTYTALHIAHKFNQKTLIVTHTTALRDQWISDVETLFGVEAGVIGSGKVKYREHVLTVANVQTLVKHMNSLGKEFGTVIVDECHHTPSSTFSEKLLDNLYAYFKIGLSGTLLRKDGKQVMFRDYFGTHVLKPAESNTLTPKIKLVNTGITLNQDLGWVDRITELINNADYINFIVTLAKGQIKKGHTVLIIADRTEFLQKVSELIGDDCVLVTGTVGDREKAKDDLLSGRKKAVAGSRQIFSEGLSINSLSCVILAIPISNNESLLDQIIGRIRRKFPGKLQPLVIDMQFSGWAGKKQNQSRLGFYLREGWEVDRVE